MESNIGIPQKYDDPGDDPMEGSVEQFEASFQSDLEQRHAWAVDQLKIHESAASSAASIIRACEAAIQAMQPRVEGPDVLRER